MEQQKQAFDQGKARKVGVEWRRIGHNLQYQRRQVKALKGEHTPEAHATIGRHKQKIRELARQQQRLPATDPLDAQYKRLFYARYADGTPVQA